jgi:O-antigen/teichoic acid export membrane protein
MRGLLPARGPLMGPDPTPSRAGSSGLEVKAVRGVPWTVLSFAATKVVALGATLVLARLLVPTDFGLISLAVLVIGALGVFNDLGLGGALIVGGRQTPEAEGTMLTVMLAMSGIGGLLVIVAAPFAAELFGDERLRWVLIGLSPTVLFGGFSWFYETLLQRELEFRLQFVARILQTVVFSIASIGLAVLGLGVWSLVIGHVGGWAVYTVALVAFAPYRPRPRFEHASAKRALVEGRGFMFQGALAFAQQNTDYFAIGRLLGPAQVGFYSLAYRLGELPYRGVAEPVARVTFPGFARMRQRSEEVAGAYCSALRMVTLIACPIGVLVSAAAGPLVDFLFGAKWAPMTGALVVLGIWGAIQPVETTAGWFLNACGRAGALATVSASFLFPHVVALFVAAHYGGIVGVSVVMLANTVVTSIFVLQLVSRGLGVSLYAQLAAIRVVVVACVATWFTARAVVAIMATSGPGLALLMSIAAGITSYLLTVQLLDPEALRTARRQAARTLRRPIPPPTRPPG